MKIKKRVNNFFLHLFISISKIVHLGIALSEVEDGSQRIVLYYTDPGTRGTQEAASFKMGDLTGRWARFTLTVQGAEVSVLCGIIPIVSGSYVPRCSPKELELGLISLKTWGSGLGLGKGDIGTLLYCIQFTQPGTEVNGKHFWALFSLRIKKKTQRLCLL